jgi:transcriptional regulator with XRE-family HTH domain
LRRYREQLGYRLDDAARVLECDRSKISRIETGQRGIRAKELRELLTEYGVGVQEQHTLACIAHPGSRHGWWLPYTAILPGTLLDFIILEAAASQIMVYQPQLVPDLLQIPEYARAFADVDPCLSADARDPMTEAILTRQRMILGGRQTELAVVIGEAALHQVAGGTGVMRAQLAQLAQACGDSSQVTCQVLRYSQGADVIANAGPFTILRFAGTYGLGVVHLPAPSGGVLLDSPHDVACYLKVFTHLRAAALTPTASAQLLQDMTASHPEGNETLPHTVGQDVR